jgi:hypothetical protein
VAFTQDIDNAYNPTPGNDWGSYNVEEQAQLVKKWFANTLNAAPPNPEDSDERFHYIQDTIRARWPWFKGKKKWTYQGPLYFLSKKGQPKDNL